MDLLASTDREDCSAASANSQGRLGKNIVRCSACTTDILLIAHQETTIQVVTGLSIKAGIGPANDVNGDGSLDLLIGAPEMPFEASPASGGLIVLSGLRKARKKEPGSGVVMTSKLARPYRGRGTSRPANPEGKKKGRFPVSGLQVQAVPVWKPTRGRTGRRTAVAFA